MFNSYHKWNEVDDPVIEQYVTRLRSDKPSRNPSYNLLGALHKKRVYGSKTNTTLAASSDRVMQVDGSFEVERQMGMLGRLSSPGDTHSLAPNNSSARTVWTARKDVLQKVSVHQKGVSESLGGHKQGSEDVRGSRDLPELTKQVGSSDQYLTSDLGTSSKFRYGQQVGSALTSARVTVSSESNKYFLSSRLRHKPSLTNPMQTSLHKSGASVSSQHREESSPADQTPAEKQWVADIEDWLKKQTGGRVFGLTQKLCRTTLMTSCYLSEGTCRCRR